LGAAVFGTAFEGAGAGVFGARVFDAEGFLTGVDFFLFVARSTPGSISDLRFAGWVGLDSELGAGSGGAGRFFKGIRSVDRVIGGSDDRISSGPPFLPGRRPFFCEARVAA